MRALLVAVLLVLTVTNGKSSNLHLLVISNSIEHEHPDGIGKFHGMFVEEMKLLCNLGESAHLVHLNSHRHFKNTLT